MEIRDLGQDTFLAGRRVIKAAKPGMFDLSKQEDRDELAHIAETVFHGELDRPSYGDLTACVLCPLPAGHGIASGTARYIKSEVPFGSLHDEAKAILRKEFPDHADEI